MDVCKPLMRHRGFFLHSSDEPDSGEHENPEGVVVRVRTARRTVARHVTGAAEGGRSRTAPPGEESRPEIRSGSVTGSRQRGHLPR